MMWTKEQIEARRDMWVRSEVHSAPVMNTEYLELCRLALRGLEHEERAERAEAEVERLQEALGDLRDMYDRLRVRAEEAESEAARLKQELEVTTDNQILWQERCFDTERECEKWKAVAKSREQPTLAADLGLALARASTAERALRNIAARVDRDGGQKQEFESVEDTAKRIDLVLANMIMHVDLLRAANGQNHR